MSTSYHAYVIFGFPIGADALLETTDVRGCDHPETSATFCGQCGKRTWVEPKHSKDVYELTSSDCRGAPNGSRPGFLRAEIGEWTGFIGILFATASPGEATALPCSPTPIEQSQYAHVLRTFCSEHDIEFDAALTRLRLVHTWS